MSDSETTRLLAQIVEQQNQLLEELRSTKKSKSNKDGWDRVGALAPIMAAAIIACVGAYFTWSYDQQQLRVQEIQTIEKFIPHLIGSEKSKRAAILAISSLGNAKLAGKVASIFASEGTASALQSIAQSTSDRKEKSELSEALARTLEQLAEKYRSENKDDEAVATYRKALSLKEEQSGKDNPDLIENLTSLSQLYEKHGDAATAKELADRAQALRAKTGGDVAQAAVLEEPTPASAPADTTAPETSQNNEPRPGRLADMVETRSEVLSQ